MPALNSFYANNNGGASTTSTTMQDGSCAVTIPALFAGRTYFVAARANFGGNDNAQVGEVRLFQVTGSVAIGLASGEGAGVSAAWGSGQFHGFFKITAGAGGDTFKLQHRNVTSSDTDFLGAMAILAVPLDQKTELDSFDNSVIVEAAPLVSGVDYYHSGTNSATAEVSSISNTWTTQRTVDFTAMEAGDYMVFISTEVLPGSGTASDGAMARFQIDAANINSLPDFKKEWETNEDRFCFAYSGKVTVTAGTHTFRIQVQNKNANAIVSAARSNIWAFKCSSFTKTASTVNTSGQSALTNTSYDATDFMTLVDVPTAMGANRAVFAYTNYSNSINNATLGQLGKTDGTAYVTDTGETQNNSGNSSDDDVIPTVAFSHENGSPSISRTHRLRSRVAAASTGTAGRNAGNTAGVHSNLLLWELAIPVLDVIETGGNSVVAFER